MKRTYLQINAEDNVAVALTDLPPGIGLNWPIMVFRWRSYTGQA